MRAAMAAAKTYLFSYVLNLRFWDLSAFHLPSSICFLTLFPDVEFRLRIFTSCAGKEKSGNDDNQISHGTE